MKIIDYVLDLMYPPRCCFCRKLTENESICNNCLKALPYTGNNAVQYGIPNVSKAVSPLYYEGDVRLSIHRFKFHSATGYASAYARLIAKTIQAENICAEVLSFVPLSKKRLRYRGYNQAELISRELSKHLNKPTEGFLLKIKNNPEQSGAGDAKSRKANVKGVYKVYANADVSGKSIILVDDVITTGSTVSECAKMLKEAGCKEVFAVSLARSK